MQPRSMPWKSTGPRLVNKSTNLPTWLSVATFISWKARGSFDPLTPYKKFLLYFHNQIQKWCIYFCKLMGHIVGHNDYVAFRQLPARSTLDALSANFIWSCSLAIHHFSASYKRCCSLDNINDVGKFRVHFRLTCLLPASGQNLVVTVFGPRKQRRTLFE